ncbi:hypothetical protein GOBAR_DD36641 [Gossypium barbadense]|nr:hypothetical protein GOBAR_DD36641 [Gossypium barbadense]
MASAALVHHGYLLTADHVFQQGDPILETKKKTKDQRYEDPHHGEGKSTNEAHRERYEQASLVSTFTFGASYVTRNKGRRASILVGAVSFFLGGASNAGAMNITMLIIESILLSAGI